jgi:glycosyltransferase involved in cell wall biosynthesis
MKLSVIVPCYNEGKNIPLIVKRFNEVKINYVELVLVDNGSTDNTKRIVNDFVPKYPYIKSVHVKKNIGYGYGIWSGIKKASSEFICWTHADMQTDLGDTIRAYNLIKNQRNPTKCFVKGTRKGRPLFDAIFTTGMSVFETIILQKVLFDINAQPNLFHKSFLEKIGNPPKDFSFDLYFYYMAKKLNFKIIRFPVLFNKRRHGESHWNTSLKGKYKFIKRTVDFTFKLKRLLK